MDGFDFAGRKLFIGLPSYDFKVSLKLAISLAKLAQEAPRLGIELQIGSICGCSVVSRARNLLAQDFLESDCTDLMFIDADINFEPNDVLRLMAWGSDPKKGIVAGVPRTRKEELVYITNLEKDADGDLIMNGRGLVRATHVATAFMMIRREVIVTLRDSHPEWACFDVQTKRDINAMFDFEARRDGYVGEDYLFCERVRAHGYEVWIDPTIKLGHMGVQEYLGDFGADALYPQITSLQKVA